MDLTDIHDPLHLDIPRQVNELLTYDGVRSFLDASQLQVLQSGVASSSLLAVLSHLLCQPRFTQIISDLFRPLIIDLCARLLDYNGGDDIIFIAFAHLLALHPEIYPILHAFCARPTMNQGPLGLQAQVQHATPEHAAQYLHMLLVAYHRILSSSPHLADEKEWPLSSLATLFSPPTPHPDRAIKLLSVLCFVIQSRMSEVRKHALIEKTVGLYGQDDAPLLHGYDPDGNMTVLDGWAFPFLERKRVEESKYPGADLSQMYRKEPQMDTSEDFLSPRVVNIEGILLFRAPNPGLGSQSTLVRTDSICKALRQLALCISLNLPPLLVGPPASGKSLAIHHLASTIHSTIPPPVVILQLADSALDPRSLFGSYQSSTSNPGQFEWRDGILIKAMKEGRWIVCKDIDKASPDVLGTILPLVESFAYPKNVGALPWIDVPGRGRTYASINFRLFATSTPRASAGLEGSVNFLGSNKFYPVPVPSPNQEELCEIMDRRFPNLAGPFNRALYDIWAAMSTLKTSISLSIRHFERLCRRCNELLLSTGVKFDNAASGNHTFSTLIPNPSLREELWIEVRDVFLGRLDSAELVKTLESPELARVALLLALSPETCRHSVLERVPLYNLEKDINDKATAILIGRHRLPVFTHKELDLREHRPFVLHSPALRLLSRVATCLVHSEPVLLVGETGTGKTSLISHVANLLHQPLISINLSLQTEVSELLGGLKPIDASFVGFELYNKFIKLFDGTFSRKKNTKFQDMLRKALLERKWKKVVVLWRQALELVAERDESTANPESSRPAKKRKAPRDSPGRVTWHDFRAMVDDFEHQYILNAGKFAFAFVDGPLVRAIKNGSWILLDEVNLASPETLESIHGLLDPHSNSFTLIESGSLEPIVRHPNFRVFACMNPSTDVGKRDIPPSIRSRFTEIFVDAPDTHRATLVEIIKGYLGNYALHDTSVLLDIAEYYLAAKELTEDRKIADGSNRRPHFSVRTLTRALSFSRECIHSLGLRRSLWEGCSLAFAMALDPQSSELMQTLAKTHLLRGVKNQGSFFSQQFQSPPDQSAYEKIGLYWIRRGGEEPIATSNYVLTPSVKSKISSLARAIFYHRSPILIEGPTSSGKTSAIQYIAARTGHRFVRINNHEHTDIQEYLGSYQSDPSTGRLEFTDGVLVRALRSGDWLVLDELNLAPTEVLEALNRLLDDNRELVVPETQEVIRPHPDFLLFATQNPHGTYGGRKALSRAFRNRFLEFHFEDVPQAELETIVCERCAIAPSFARKIVAVFRELQIRRQSTRLFESKESFATLRDVFRWGNRKAYDIQALAEDGFMLLGEKTRSSGDRLVVKEVIESILGVRLRDDIYKLFGRDTNDIKNWLDCSPPSDEAHNMVWTPSALRLFVLLTRALRFREPVLLVGEPGSGKTSMCELYALAVRRNLVTLNCHQNTETADLIGSQRPAHNHRDPLQEKQSISGGDNDRDRSLALFHWQDGPLIQAMRDGNIFLLDELSLADDAVLERLNSVLEPDRTLVLAENPATSGNETIVASEEFRVLATMNPGGDYGKKELSPALRNRFTEIWVPVISEREELNPILESILRPHNRSEYVSPMLDFRDWLETYSNQRAVISLRDMLAWARFIADASTIDSCWAFHHGCLYAFLDGLEMVPQLAGSDPKYLQDLRQACKVKLEVLVPLVSAKVDPFSSALHEEATTLSVGIFSIKRRSSEKSLSHNFRVTTTRSNLFKLVRACQVERPILLEGSPGVGKTSLVANLAQACGQPFFRLNLSDQTDLTDLFGTELPMEGDVTHEFAWRDAEFLTAMQNGSWVLLDEMNLAPQAVLEGLNAVLDHRGTVFIPELGRSFHRHPGFRVFAAQNPLHQGGGRKGLPKSFLDRFAKVYIEPLLPSDMNAVVHSVFPSLSHETTSTLVESHAVIEQDVQVAKHYGREGSPWEFNVRDLLRWVELEAKPTGLEQGDGPGAHVVDLYVRRFRSQTDQDLCFRSTSIFRGQDRPRVPWLHVGPAYTQTGNSFVKRGDIARYVDRPLQTAFAQLAVLETMTTCINHGWLVILVGRPSTGKTTAIELLANVHGARVSRVFLNASTDTSDILGGFEQIQTNDPSQLGADRYQMTLQAARSFAGEAPFRSDVPTEAALPRDPEGRAVFRWKDGPVVEALKTGSWLVLENANLCPASVLDRLNSLCEIGGLLVLNERGSIDGQAAERIIPHPNFRILMTLDPKHGELSPAMRNRGVELYMGGEVNFTEGLHYPAKQALSTRGLAQFPSRSSLLLPGLPSGMDSLVDIASFQSLFLDRDDFVLDAETKIIWLLQTSPVNLLLPLLRLWHSITVLHEVVDVLAAIAGNFVHEKYYCDSAMPLWSRHGELMRYSGLSRDFLLFQPLDLSANPNFDRNSEMTRSSTTALQLTVLLEASRMRSRRVQANFGQSYREAEVTELRHHKAKQHSIQLMQQVQELCRALLVGNGDWDAPHEDMLRAALDIAIDVQQIYGMVEDSSRGVDYLHLQLITKRMFHQSQRFKALGILGDYLRLLLDCVTPGSGLYMLPIWRQFKLETDGRGTIPELEIIDEDGNLSNLCQVVETLRELSGLKWPEAPVRPWGVQSQLEWFSRVWHLSSGNSQILHGPAVLLRPSLFAAFFHFCGPRVQSMRQLARREFGIKVITCGLASELAERKSQGRLLQMVAILNACIQKIEIALSDSDLITKPPEGIHLHAGQIGRLWCDLGHRLLELYLPDIPMDPLQAQRNDRSFYEQRLRAKQAHRALLDSFSAWKLGSSSEELCPWVSYETNMLSQVLEAMPKVEQVASGARDPATLQNLFTQLWLFKQQLVSRDGLGVTLSSTPETLAQEETFQSNMTHFLDRLIATYGNDYYDLISPVILASHYIKFGLRIQVHFARASANELTGVAKQFFTALVTTPTPVAFQLFRSIRIADITTSRSPVYASTMVLARLASAVMEIEWGLPLTFQADVIDESLRFLTGQWAIEEARLAKEELDASTLFKPKVTNFEPLDDAALEEKELLELFPTYDDAAGGIEDEEPPRKATLHRRTAQPVEHIVSTLHLIATRISSSLPSPGSAQEIYESIRSDISLILSSDGVELPPELDDKSIGLRISLLATIFQKNGVPSSNQSRPFDFYRDSNVSEISKAQHVLLRLEARLEQLIEVWPEQSVLADLLDRCQRVLKLELEAPIAKVLGAIEAVLTHSTDWENYSSREFSIKDHQQELINLIVEWRRLELSYWPNLLRIEEDQTVAATSKLWFQLSNIILRGSMALLAAPESDQINHKELVLATVDKVLADSPLGQYSKRLDMIQAFTSYLRLASESVEMGGSYLSSIVRVLGGLGRYYSLARDEANRTLEVRKKPIENDIREYVKLASWKDINIIALKESARKSHRRLHKAVRQFRQLLAIPVSTLGLLSSGPDHHGAILEEQGKASGPMFSAPQGTVASSQDSRFEKYSQVLDDVRDTMTWNHIVDLDEWVNSVIGVAKSLQDATIKTTDAEPRKRKLKSLLSQKRRAWSDLLREMKSMGLSSQLRPEVLAQHTSRLWLLDQPTLDQGLGRGAIDSETYFIKILRILGSLESSLLAHHIDLSTRELQRGRALVLNLFRISVVVRSRLSRSFSAYLRLRALTDRIGELVKQPKHLSGREDLPVAISKIWSATVRATQSLKQVCTLLRQMSTMEEMAMQPPDQLADLLENHRQTGESLCTSLCALHGVISTTRICSLTQDEYQLLSDASRFLRQIRTVIEDCMEHWGSFRSLFVPFHDWLQGLEPGLPNELLQNFGQKDPGAHSTLKLQNLLLVIAQDLVSRHDQKSKGDLEQDISLLEDLEQFEKLHNALRLDRLELELQDALRGLQFMPEYIATLAAVLPFLDTILHFMFPTFVAQSRWVRALFKQVYVMASIVTDLATRGFCQPPPDTTAEQNSANAEPSNEPGTGFGEGSGGEHVKDDKIDEDQVEGLEGEDGGDQENVPPRDDEREAPEVENMDDARSETMEQPDENGSPKGENDHETPLEEKIDDLDLEDPNILDEKLWGNQNPQEDEAAAQENSRGAAEKPQSGEDGGAKDEKTDQSQEQPEDDVNLENQQEDVSDSGDAPDLPPPGESGASMDHLPESDVLDLPDDLSLGDDDEGGDAAMDGELGEDEFSEAEIEATPIHEDDSGHDQDEEMQNSDTLMDLGVGDMDIDEMQGADKNTPSTGRAGGRDAAETRPNTNEGEDPEPKEMDPSAVSSALGREGASGKEQGVDEVPQQTKSSNDTAMAMPDSETAPNDVEGVATIEDDDETNPQSEARALGSSTLENARSSDPNKDVGSMDVDEQLDLREPPLSLPQSQVNEVPPATAERILHKLSIESSVIPQNPLPKHGDTMPEDLSLGDAPPLEQTPQNRAGILNAVPVEWRDLESRVQSHAYSLCEQLRLIIEPTLAARLKGDYRTGKRLNMKKIIPYIASNYSKDKIWLRRTKPSRREYQVLLALDDSKSMSQSNAVDLALQTLALVTSSLSKLEVGELAIARFGTTMDIVHDFSSGSFTAVAGEKVLEAFQFGQTSTDMLALLESSLGLLSKAREERSMSSTKGSELWQLEVIISDGICQNHAELAPLLRRALEQRILIVFVVLDALASSGAAAPSSSITAMNQVGYKDINGRMELTVDRYLDTFPFDYYIIVQDIASLPDVLSRTLRQFFATVSDV